MLPGKDVGDDGPGADWAVDGSAADTGGGADKSPAAKSWILTAGGSSLDFGRTIVVDASGNAHFTAEFEDRATLKYWWTHVVHSTCVHTHSCLNCFMF